ncbi:MAG TPA: BrnT family toxin [Sphingomonas sp.]|nr:BrnT family toxin [Sphingomonas sp.]
MEIEFDSAKDEANTAKHGVSLAFGARVFDDTMHIVLTSIRPVDGEDRFKAIGMVEGRLWTAIHVLRGSRVRFISVRKSNDGEERIYHRP